MDPVMIGGAAVGLVLGSFGYVLVRFWARPLFAYRRLKTRLAEGLSAAAAENTLSKELGAALRRLAIELQDLADEGLPVWFSITLQRRGEAPKEAVRHLQTLVNCREPAAIRRRVAAVRQSLRLPQ